MLTRNIFLPLKKVLLRLRLSSRILIPQIVKWLKEMSIKDYDITIILTTAKLLFPLHDNTYRHLNNKVLSFWYHGMVKINPKIFRDNDIRGVYPEDLNEEIIKTIAKGLYLQFKPKKVCVGMDMRVSGPSLKAAIIEQFIELGVEVIDVGMITTPMSFFASTILEVDLAMIVSASHNPKEYNGLIISAAGGYPVGKEKLKELAEIVNGEEINKIRNEGNKAGVEQQNLTERWLDHAFKIVNPQKIRPLKVVFDNGNSVTSVALEPALERLKQIDAVKLYFEPDGTFPHHAPNPLIVDNLKDLCETVKKEKADLGLAYDGDGDRVLMVDEEGEVVTGAVMTAFLAKYLLHHKKISKKPTILYTTVMSRVVPETIEKYGGKAIRVPVGHAIIKAKMSEEKAWFAGEHSGHFYFKENHNADSALLGTLLILAAVSSEERKASEQLKEFRVYLQNEEISVKVEDRDSFIKKAEEILMAAKEKPLSKTLGDGITFDYKDYWFNLRPSGTEPVVRLNIESYKPDKLGEVVKNILKVVKEAGGNV